MKRWELIFNIVFAVIGFGGSVATLWTFFQGGDSSWKWGASVVILVFGIAYIIIQAIIYRRESKKVYIHPTQERVNQYLYEWLEKSGYTVIFTRDFSWAHCNDEMWNLLVEKAKKHNLIVCLKVETPDTDELKTAGAKIYVHDIDNLQSRFIIAHYKTHSPRITVGSRINGSFVNEQYDMQSSPNACNVFVELFESTKAASLRKAARR